MSDIIKIKRCLESEFDEAKLSLSEGEFLLVRDTNILYVKSENDIVLINNNYDVPIDELGNRVTQNENDIINLNTITDTNTENIQQNSTAVFNIQNSVQNKVNKNGDNLIGTFNYNDSILNMLGSSDILYNGVNYLKNDMASIIQYLNRNRLETVWTGVVNSGNGINLDLKGLGYAFYVAYVGANLRPILLIPYDDRNNFEGSTTGVYTEISSTGRTSYTMITNGTSSVAYCEAFVHYNNGGHSGSITSTIYRIDGVNI